MAAGEKLSNVPTIMGKVAGKAATSAGQALADKSISQTTSGFDTMQQAASVPGMMSVSGPQGQISTMSTPQSIDAADMAIFGTTGAQLDAGRSLDAAIASTPMGMEAAQTGMVTTSSGETTQTFSSPTTVAAQDAATFGAISTGSGVGSASEAAATGMTTTDSGDTVSNDATIAAQDAAMFGDTSSSGGGGDGKIICTAMNEAYGFGSFRNQIWLSYAAKHLTKEHEVGYHAMFLPLVDVGFKQNKWYSAPVRKILEWGTRHRSADLRAEMRGRKRDRTGQMIRFIFEPLCYLVDYLNLNSQFDTTQ
jgi:hypothetical protein